MDLVASNNAISLSLIGWHPSDSNACAVDDLNLHVAWFTGNYEDSKQRLEQFFQGTLKGCLKASTIKYINFLLCSSKCKVLQETAIHLHPNTIQTEVEVLRDTYHCSWRCCLLDRK